MITAVAFCPQAPALVPELGRGLDAELGPVREACRTAIRRVADSGARLVVIGGADVAGEYGPTSRGSFAGHGLQLTVPLGSDGDGALELPPSLTVGAWLVRDALGPNSGATGVAVDAARDLPDFADRVALVVVGDGSARRSEKAPGHLHPDAERFDAQIADGMRRGRGYLMHVQFDGPFDQGDLMVAGAAAWDALAGRCEEWAGETELLYEGAPFGVGYFVAAWTGGDPTPEALAAQARTDALSERWRTDPEFRARHRIVIRG